MSVLDFFKKGRRSTRQLIGAKLIENTGVETFKNEYLVYFLIKPTNIAVLSESAVRAKVKAFTNILKELDEMEIACINSRESFEENKNYYIKRLEEEKNPKVRELLKKDLMHLDRIQIQTASAREFMIIKKFAHKDNNPDKIRAETSRINRLLKEQGFIAKIADKEDIKRFFSVYYVQNLTQVYFDDFDGERFVKADLM